MIGDVRTLSPAIASLSRAAVTITTASVLALGAIDCRAAEPADPPGDGGATQRIEVVGTLPLQSVKTPLREVPANVQSGSARQIDRQQSSSLGEFLDANVGSVNASNSVGNPFQMDISYRGFTASPILGTAIGLSVFVDGVRINEPFGDVVNWDLIAPNAIAGIDVVPGSNPLFGFNTLGGAIVVATKDGEHFPGLSASVYGGSWGRYAAQVEYGAVDEVHGTDYFVAANVFHEDGYRDFSKSDVAQLFGKARWHDDRNTLDASVALADNQLYGPAVLPLSMLGDPRYAYTAPDIVRNKLAMLALKGSHQMSKDASLEGNVYFRLSNSLNANSNAGCDDDVDGPENCVANQASGDLDAANVIATTDQRGYGGALQLNLLGDLWRHGNRLAIGGSIDASNIGYQSNNYGANLVGEVTTTIDPSGADAINQTGSNPYGQGSTSLKTRTNDYGLFASDNFRFDERWNATVSGRFNYATVDLDGGTDDGTGNIGSLVGNHAFHRFNPAVGLNFNPTSTLTLYGSYNEGMRVPTPVELSCANPLIPCALPTGFTSDPDLHMIVSKTWELGARGKLTAALGWDAAVYDTRNGNDIQFIANGANAGVTGFFKNVGDTRRQGLELGLNGKVAGLTFSAHYGLVNATYQSGFVEASPQNSAADGSGNITVGRGDRIPGIARQTFKLRLDCDITPAWTAGGSFNATSGQFAHGDENNQDANGMLRGYALLNVDTHYAVSPAWSIFAKVTNLLDRTDYHTFGILAQNMFTAGNELAVVPSQPRGIWVGVKYQFGGK